MKIVLIISALANGGYMLLDGLYVMMKGKYIGPEKPGPWSGLFELLHINVFQLGPLFIAYGIGWLVYLVSLLTAQSWSWTAGLVMGIATLWYLPFGTLLSIITLILLIGFRSKLGI